MYNISAIPPEMLDLVWPQVEPILMRPIERSHGDVTIESTKKRLYNGDILLVVISIKDKIIACNTLEARTMESGKRVMCIPLTGGDNLDDWIHDFHKVAEALAKDFNCEELRGFAVRKGWLRKLAPFGWQDIQTTIVKKVER